MMVQFGAAIWESQDNNGNTIWHVCGIPGFAEVSSIKVNVGNSGTSLYLGSAVAALFSRPVRFDGDASIRARSTKNLLQALQELGAELQREGSDYCCPYTLCGPIRGAKIRLCAPTSQYLSALLLVLPLLKGDANSEIYLDLLNEHPYIDMTLGWLRQQGIQWQNSGYDWFKIPGNQRYRPFEQRIPSDFSSASFLLCAAAITGARIRLRGLCPNDSQGDARVLDFLQEMGCSYAWQQQNGENGQKTGTSYTLEFSGPDGAVLQGKELDLSQTPDALPAMAVACACAVGKSRLYNVAHARNKECDRIAAMAAELQALGFSVREQPDGLNFAGGKNGFINRRRAVRQTRGYGDHRIIMALSLLNLLQPLQPLELDDCTNAAITYPNFFADLAQLFGKDHEK